MVKNKNGKHPAVIFLKSLYQHCEGGFINLRFIHKDTHQVKNKFLPLSEIETIPRILKKYQNDHNCYFGVATRREGDGTKAGIIQIPALFLDVDTKGLSIPQKQERRKLIMDFPLKTAHWIHTGGGAHVYWLLKEPATKEDIPVVEDLLKRLALHLGGDSAATDASRILRVPGTQNWKYPGKLFVTLTQSRSHPECQYNLSDFDSILPELKESHTDKESNRLPAGWEKEILAGVPDGERDVSITRLAGRYVGKGLSRDEILPILSDANSRFKPPLPIEEIEKCLDSVIRTDQRNRPAPGDEKKLSAPLPELPTLGDIYDLDIKVEWVVEKLIPKQAITVLHGKGGIGKTWLMLQAGSCISVAVPFCGLATQGMPCYYIDFENPLAILHDRAFVLGKSDLRVWHSSNPTPPPRLDSDEWKRYKDLPPGFLIVDSLRAAQLLDENSSRDMTIIMMRLKVLRDLGFTIVLIHHTPKSDERTYKGSTAIQDQCDHVLSLDRVRSVGSDQEIEEEDEEYPLRLGVRGKSRYEHFSIYLQFDPTRGFDLAPDPDESSLKDIHSLLVEFKTKEGRGPNQSQIVSLAKELRIKKRKLFRLLRKGEGRSWTTTPQTQFNATLYDPIFASLPLYRPYIVPENVQTGEISFPTDDKPQGVEPPENTLFARLPDPPKKNVQTGVFSLPGTSEKNGTVVQTENDPKTVIESLLKTGSFTPLEICEKSALAMEIVKNYLAEWEKDGRLVKESGVTDPDERYCYSWKE